jgi:hypothetical protein
MNAVTSSVPAPMSACSVGLFLVGLLFTVSLAGFPVTSIAEGAASSGGLSFTEQCPTLLKIADDFAHECIAKAHTWSYEVQTFAGHKATISKIAYFRPTTPQSHFSLGCVLNNHDQKKIDYIGVYYSTKGSNFALADSDKAEWRNIDWYGNVGLIADGEPINLVLVRPFDTGSMSFSDEGFGMHFLLKDGAREKNCEMPKPLHMERVENEASISIEVCGGPNCDENEFKTYDTFFAATKRPHKIIGEDVFDGPFSYTRFFNGGDHQIIYRNAGFYIESDGALLMRSSILQDDCSVFSYLIRGTHKGNLTIPNIAQEICRLPHQP